MFADNLARAIATAPTNHLDELARAVWQAHASGVLDDTTAQDAAERLHARKLATRPPPATVPFVLQPRRRQCSPDKQVSLERRRRLAASGPLPPALAAHFTTAQLAVLRIVGDEMRAHGVCGLHVDAIAARAGVGRTSVQNALREAKGLGLVTVQERRRRGQPSDTNLVRVVSREWQTWLRLSAEGGFKKKSTTDTWYLRARKSEASLTTAPPRCTQYSTQRDATPWHTTLQRLQRPPG